MEEKFVVVASYLTIGLTEEDLHYIRKHLLQFGANTFLTVDDKIEDIQVELVNDDIYPCIALKVDGVVWERFTRSHDMLEYSLALAQNSIWTEVH